VSDATVLVVDDEPDMVENCARILRRAGYRCLTTTDPRRALALLGSDQPDLLLTDLKMPEIDGLELMRHAHQVDAAIPVVVITAFATIESAVAAIKQGAYDYLPKNFSVDQLTLVVERALRARSLSIENRNLREQLREARGLESLIGRSPAMIQVIELVKKAARAEANILVSANRARARS
jgi:DNA-binding NtrC family response regulator